jgi:4a-hydroxytetrahydrobiopterin dehydratase
MAVLSDDEIGRRLGDAEGWERHGDSLRKQFEFDDFKGSVDFVNRISAPAEEMNHHPDLAVSWSTVTVTLSTHSQGGITESDFELAAKIDPLA